MATKPEYKATYLSDDYEIGTTPKGKKNTVQGVMESETPNAGRGKQGGPTADELDTDRNRKYREAMMAEYASRAKMLGKTTDQYVKDQAAKERTAREKAPIEDFMTDSGMKKGGVAKVKGWGIARGARKAKNY